MVGKADINKIKANREFEIANDAVMGRNGDTCEMRPRPLSGEGAPVRRPVWGREGYVTGEEASCEDICMGYGGSTEMFPRVQ